MEVPISRVLCLTPDGQRILMCRHMRVGSLLHPSRAVSGAVEVTLSTAFSFLLPRSHFPSGGVEDPRGKGNEKPELTFSNSPFFFFSLNHFRSLKLLKGS